MHELLEPMEMGKADRLTIEAGRSGMELMEKAGLAVANAASRMTTYERRVVVLAGPGNNGGDAFVAARHLIRRGHVVDLFLLGAPDALKGDAREAYNGLGFAAVPMEQAFGPLQELGPYDLIIDGLFGAGLDRPLEGAALAIAEAINDSHAKVLAIDLPSGLDGRTGQVLGAAVKADATVTFFRAKPGHYVYPGRGLCGALTIAQIGIHETVFPEVAVAAYLNTPELWRAKLPRPAEDGHKYDRGHLLVYSGGEFQTGAARLAAMSGQRVGAGLTTVVAPPDAARIHAAHFSSIMVRSVESHKALQALLTDHRINSFVIGPAAGTGSQTRSAVELIASLNRHVVLDADAISVFEGASKALASALQESSGACVMTPHMGEFSRLFPDLAHDEKLSKLDQARMASADIGATVVLKGPDTVIAAPDGRVALNSNGSPWLATGGSGDVLAGIVGGLLAQGVAEFEAAAMAVWLHGAAAQSAGAMLVPEDLIAHLPKAYAQAFEAL